VVRWKERSPFISTGGKFFFILKYAAVLCKFMSGSGAAFGTLHSVVMEERVGSHNRQRTLTVPMIQIRSGAHVRLF